MGLSLVQKKKKTSILNDNENAKVILLAWHSVLHLLDLRRCWKHGLLLLTVGSLHLSHLNGVEYNS